MIGAYSVMIRTCSPSGGRSNRREVAFYPYKKRITELFSNDVRVGW